VTPASTRMAPAPKIAIAIGWCYKIVDSIRPARSSGAEKRRAMTDPIEQTHARRVWYRLLRLEARMRVAVSERLRSIDLSVPQCDVLSTLTEKEGVSQQELAQRLYVTKGNISGLLDRLEQAGLVERRPTPGDRRQYAIGLTAEGRRRAEQAIALQHEIIADTFGKLPDAVLSGFEENLIAVRDRFRALDGGRSNRARGPLGSAAE